MKTFPINLIADRQAEVLIYDLIGVNPFTGEGISSKGFAEQLAALGPLDTLTLRISSRGGSIFEGMAIYNALVRNTAKVHVQIDGVAGSAASFIAMAGDRIEAAQNASIMIHRAMYFCDGNCNEMRKAADVLEQLDGSISGVYAARTGRRAETFLALMDKETWFSPEEALKNRLIDGITPNKGVPVAIAPEPRAYLKPDDLLAMAAMVKDIIPRNAAPENAPEEETDLELYDEEVESPLNASPVDVQARLAEYAARVKEVTAVQ